jgi:putative glutamine amidotransferase
MIGIIACSGKIGPHTVQLSNDKYAQAVATAAEALPVIVPVFPALMDPARIIAGLDGLLFTGSPSNIEPHHYGGPPSPPGTEHDPARDNLALALWRSGAPRSRPAFRCWASVAASRK